MAPAPGPQSPADASSFLASIPLMRAPRAPQPLSKSLRGADFLLSIDTGDPLAPLGLLAADPRGQWHSHGAETRPRDRVLPVPAPAAQTKEIEQAKRPRSRPPGSGAELHSVVLGTPVAPRRGSKVGVSAHAHDLEGCADSGVFSSPQSAFLRLGMCGVAMARERRERKRVR